MPSFSGRVEEDIPPGLRLDRYIAEHLKLLSRSQIKARRLEACLNGKTVKVSRLLYGGESVELAWQEAESIGLIPQALPLEIVYEDDRVIVVNKAQGMVVHPGAGNRQGTLANALLYRRQARFAGLSNGEGLSAIGDVPAAIGLRPGIVHRLDKDTSGLIIAAWDDEALDFLSSQFRARKVRKTYAAIVPGSPRDTQGRIENKIVRSRRDRKSFTVSDTEGRLSVTYFKTVKSYGGYSLLLLRPKTGRTHQLRVHLKSIGLPILGDPVYGRKDPRFPDAALMLHAKRLTLSLPGGGNRITFRTPLPGRFREILSRINDK